MVHWLVKFLPATHACKCTHTPSTYKQIIFLRYLRKQISSLLPAACTLHRPHRSDSPLMTPESPSVWNPSEASSLWSVGTHTYTCVSSEFLDHCDSPDHSDSPHHCDSSDHCIILLWIIMHPHSEKTDSALVSYPDPQYTQKEGLVNIAQSLNSMEF